AFEGHSPHRPGVDAVKVACAQWGAPVARVPDVGNVWLDAGIVAFSTLNYRHDRDYWSQSFPADLVLEEFAGQFRNPVSAVLPLAAGVGWRPPAKPLLGCAAGKRERGDAVHKSEGNPIWFVAAAAWMGVEPLRWLFASAPLERNVHFGRGLVEETARRLQ